MYSKLTVNFYYTDNYFLGRQNVGEPLWYKQLRINISVGDLARPRCPFYGSIVHIIPNRSHSLLGSRIPNGSRSPVVFWSFQSVISLRSRLSRMCQVHQVPISQRVLHHSYTGLIQHLRYSLTFFTVTDQIAL